jgi:hypothetical protein
MDFAALPPEINSGRMYSGPGSASTLSAAATWRHLSVELNLTATAFAAQIASLVDGTWEGPASAAMARVAAAHVQWLTAASGLALDSATRADAADLGVCDRVVAHIPPVLDYIVLDNGRWLRSLASGARRAGATGGEDHDERCRDHRGGSICHTGLR